MITFYFRGMPASISGYSHGVDSLCSWECSADELKEIFGPCGKNESIHIVAEFDNSHTPPLLRRRSTRYVFKDMLRFREDFPRFFTDERDGCVWESEQLDGWGKIGKTPVMPGPGYKVEPPIGRYQPPVIPILYKRYSQPLDLDKP